MPNQMNGTACPRCRRPDSVRHEKVIRGTEAFVYYQCEACRYSWQVPDAEARSKTPPGSHQPVQGQPYNDDR
jgi:transposase-like protein